MNKKGLTPLVATFLLLVFALGIGAVTMNWGKAYVDKINIEEVAEPPTAIVINPAALDDPLKKLQVQYITGSISKEEYLQREQDFLTYSAQQTSRNRLSAAVLGLFAHTQDQAAALLPTPPGHPQFPDP